MRLLRLYTEMPLREGDSVVLRDNSFHYLSRVLKAKVNQKITLFDNTGYDYHGCIKVLHQKVLKYI